jgi:hypothetical protein
MLWECRIERGTLEWWYPIGNEGRVDATRLVVRGLLVLEFRHCDRMYCSGCVGEAGKIAPWHESRDSHVLFQ